VAFFLVFCSGALFSTILFRILAAFSKNRGRGTGTVLRLKFLMAVFLLSAPIWAFLHWSPAFSGKDIFFLASKITALTALSWIFLESFTEFFLYGFLSKKLGIDFPVILVDVFKGIFYLAFFAFLLHIILHLDLSPLLTTSAILTVIVGLAFQDTLGNVIAGLALHFASPYQVGDWIQVGEMEGKILRIEWRSTSILTRSHDAIIIPHIVMAKNQIYNFSAPSSRHARELKIPLDYRYPPEKVIRVLVETAKGVEGILKNPPPQAYISAFQDNRAVYGLWVWLDDFERLPDILNLLATRVWYALLRAGFTLGAGRQRIVMEPYEKEDPYPSLVVFLGKLPLFEGIEKSSLESLARNAQICRFAEGEKIIKEGEVNQDFYILLEGEAEVLKNGLPFHTFHVGDFFGEMALLTGEPRKATISAKGEAAVLLFEKKVLAPFLESHPPFLTKLSEAIGERLKTLPVETLVEVENVDTQSSSFAGTVLNRIKNFFLSSSS
jgi:small-conductance mechanosensitive channel/CRP-like cAMP-binding protein